MHPSRKVNTLIFLLQIHGILTEPQCSKFHYEEKLLEKMIKMEFLVQNMKTEIEILTDSAKKTLSDLQAEREKWEKSIKDIKETSREKVASFIGEANKNVTNKLEELHEAKETLLQEMKEIHERSIIVFSARYAKSTSLTRGQTMTYKEVSVNEGDAYNIENGVFTVPVSGIYSFSAQFCMHPGKYVDFALVANEVAIKISRIQRKERFSCYSYDAVSSLKTGDNVKIKIVNTSSGDVLGDTTCCYWNMFSGVFIRSR